MKKLYDRIDFVDYTTPALNDTNMNRMSKAIDDIDNRIIDMGADISTAEAEATAAQSWAIGGTGTRTGEDTNNAKYWCEQSEQRAGASWGTITGTLSKQTDLQTALDAKADSATTLAGYGIKNAYTKNEVDTELDNKADNATTLEGYGITDAYTKTEVDSALDAKASKSDIGTGTLSITQGSKTTTFSANATEDVAITITGGGGGGGEDAVFTGYLVQNIADGVTPAEDSTTLGHNSQATGSYSLAEGGSTTASGYGSHSEGINTIASGYASHAEGETTTASGYASHASGSGTVASGNFQTVIGTNNVEDTSNTYALIVGNGSSSKDSNALTVDWKGNLNVSNNITAHDVTSSIGNISLSGMETKYVATRDMLTERDYLPRNYIRMTDATTPTETTVNGVTFTYKGDGTWKAVGVATELPTEIYVGNCYLQIGTYKAIYRGSEYAHPSIALQVYDAINEKNLYYAVKDGTFSVTENGYYKVYLTKTNTQFDEGSSNVFKPLITNSDSDYTYSNFVAPNDDTIADIVNETADTIVPRDELIMMNYLAENLFIPNGVSGSADNVTYTYNNDGTWSVTKTGEAEIDITIGTFSLVKGKYKVFCNSVNWQGYCYTCYLNLTWGDYSANTKSNNEQTFYVTDDVAEITAHLIITAGGYPSQTYTDCIVQPFLFKYDSSIRINDFVAHTKTVAEELDDKADLTDIGSATLTIKQNGTEVGTFSANATEDVTLNLTGGSGGGTWGSITGTLSNQTDLQTALDAKATETEVSALKDDITTFQEEGYLGKNLLPYPYYNSSLSGFTVNSDGSVTLASGTYSSTTYFYLTYNNLALPKGKYILNGCPSDGGAYRIDVRTSTFEYITSDNGSGATFTLDSDVTDYSIAIRVGSGTTLTENKTFYPMIRLATDTDSTYQPYVPSNSTLNEALTDLQTDVSSILGNVVLNARAYSSVNAYFTANYSSIFTSKCPITTFEMTLSGGDVIAGIGALKDGNNNSSISGIYVNNLQIYSFRIISGTYSEQAYAKA